MVVSLVSDVITHTLLGTERSGVPDYVISALTVQEVVRASKQVCTV